MKTQIATRSQHPSSGDRQQTQHRQPKGASRAAISSNTLPGIPEHIATKTVTGEPLILRAATVADAAQMAATGSRGFAAVHQSAVPDEDMQEVLAILWSEQQLAGMLENPEIRFLVAEVDQRIVGLICLNPTYRPSYLRQSKQVELCRFYVHPEWINCGVGSKLMSYALRQAAQSGYGIGWLRVWQGNKSSIDFYRRWGFTTVFADYYSVGDTMLPVWVMIHALA